MKLKFFNAFVVFIFVLSLIAMAIDTHSVSSNQDAENPCYFCHVDLIFEMKDGPHEGAGILCSECHGESAGHVFAEDNSVKPDRVIKPSEAGNFCGSCHETEFGDLQSSSHSSKTEKEGTIQPTCISCHSAHGYRGKETILEGCIECHGFENDKKNDSIHRLINRDSLLFNFHSLKKNES